GAAAPRVVGLAIVRDLYSGRDMARIMSFAMMVFTLVPAVAPLLGAGVISLVGWRGIFGSFIIFSVFSVGWLMLRQPESLPVENRRPFKVGKIGSAIKEMFAHPTVRLSIATQTLCFATLFMSISLIQPIFDDVFDRAASFPFWFAVVALVSGTASLLNAAMVMRFGMRRMITVAVAMQVVAASAMSLAWMNFGLNGLPGDTMFYVFVIWITSVFFNAGLTLGNLNAITMEPMGHIAGTAASVSGGVATVISAAIAAPVGLTFNGTPLPLTIGVAIAMVAALFVMLWMQRLETRAAVAAQ
ncbi:MAG: MFS transporter, partial [Pseudomonadota bacterium]|nr:MFS transporter [Pseudomonadota bacterium]